MVIMTRHQTPTTSTTGFNFAYRTSTDMQRLNPEPDSLQRHSFHHQFMRQQEPFITLPTHETRNGQVTGHAVKTQQ